MMGDPAQIPPVGKKDSEPFLSPETHEIKTFELTTIMRHKEGSQIAEAGFVVRNNLFHSDSHSFPSGKEVEVWEVETKRDELADYIVKLITSHEFAKEPDYMKVIAWRNATVKNYNRFMRKHHFKNLIPEKKHLNKIEIGDRLISNKPVIKKEEWGV
jgi:hypothetical protein